MAAMNPDQRSSLDIEDHAALRDYLATLRDELVVSGKNLPKDLAFETLDGGVSNKTVLIKFPDSRGWVIKQALAKLRTKADWFSDPQRVHREAMGIRALNKLVPSCVPEFVFEDFDHHLLIMQAVPQPHENWKNMLMAGSPQKTHVCQFGILLGQIHAQSQNHSSDLSKEFGDAGFFESLRLEPYYLYAAEQVPRAAEFLHDLVGETRRTRLALVHGDYSPKNILVHRDRLILLDHEVIHWGDPAFDIGFAMAHLLSKARHFPERRADFQRAAKGFWDSYRSCLSATTLRHDIERRAIRHSLACMLARVAGRSPLEYLSDSEKDAQQSVVVKCLANPPTMLSKLIELLTSN